MFLGQAVVRYDANIFTPPSPWGIGVILVPVLGSLAVTFLVTTFAPEATVCRRSWTQSTTGKG